MSFHEILLEKSPVWTLGEGEDNDVVLSTRVRLARNFLQQRFPNRQDREEALQVWKHLADFAADSEGYQFYRMDDMDALDKQALLAKHLISPQHIATDERLRAVVLKEDFSQSIMINEEDHLRMQTFSAGLATGVAWQAASQLDDAVGSYGDYAFHKKLGYLTSCPTNIGTGLRVSVMLHLPAMVAYKQVSVMQQIANMGMTVRGFFGEGTEASGNLYQLSNQMTLGQSEEDILSTVQSVAKQIVRQERQLRENFLKQGNVFEDQCYRAIGTLMYARIITSDEAYQLLSIARLGVSMGVIKEWTLEDINKLFLYAHPGYIQFIDGTSCDAAARDKLRAQFIKTQLQSF